MRPFAAGAMHDHRPLRRADEGVHAIPVPIRPTVFVRGDVRPGNTVPPGDTVRALIDWKTAASETLEWISASCANTWRSHTARRPQVRAGRLGASCGTSQPATCRPGTPQQR